MKRMIVYKNCSYVIMALLCTACAAGSPEEDMEDRVRIDPVAGGYYPSISPSAQTRGATPDGETLKDRPIFLLEDGSTIRLVVYDDAKNLLEEYSKAYLVRNAGTSGSSLLYPCEVDDNGAVISSSSTPLYMKAGTYYFRILSPAKALNSKGFVNIGNGEYLLASSQPCFGKGFLQFRESFLLARLGIGNLRCRSLFLLLLIEQGDVVHRVLRFIFFLVVIGFISFYVIHCGVILYLTP